MRLSARALSDGELIGLVLDTDDPKLLRTLVSHGLSQLATAPPDELADAGTLSPPAAARLSAAFELGRRATLCPVASRTTVRTPQDIYQVVRPLLTSLRREETWVLCLGPKGQLLKTTRVAEGSAWACQVDPREVFAPALSCRATGIVLAHNHPSGDCSPSAADVALTRQLVAGARLLCLQLLDHLIVGDGSFWSMASRGDLDSPTLTSPPPQ